VNPTNQSFLSPPHPQTSQSTPTPATTNTTIAIATTITTEAAIDIANGTDIHTHAGTRTEPTRDSARGGSAVPRLLRASVAGDRSRSDRCRSFCTGLVDQVPGTGHFGARSKEAKAGLRREAIACGNACGAMVCRGCWTPKLELG
jgi:hypothetical protein